MPRIRLPSGNEIAFSEGGQGPVVLQIGGAALSKHQFQRISPLLRNDCRVLDVELPGYGQNEKPNHGGTIDGWAADLNDLIGMLDLGSVTIHGASVGGFIAMSAAAARPDLTNGLIVSSSVLRANRYMKMMRENWSVIAMGLGMRQLATTMALASFTPSFIDTDEGLAQIRHMQDAFEAVDAAKFVAAQRDVMAMDLRDITERIDTRTLLIASRNDSLYPLFMEPFGTGLGDAQKMIRNAYLYLIEDCGHSFYIERANECAAAISAFVHHAEPYGDSSRQGTNRIKDDASGRYS